MRQRRLLLNPSLNPNRPRQCRSKNRRPLQNPSLLMHRQLRSPCRSTMFPSILTWSCQRRSCRRRTLAVQFLRGRLRLLLRSHRSLQRQRVRRLPSRSRALQSTPTRRRTHRRLPRAPSRSRVSRSHPLPDLRALRPVSQYRHPLAVLVVRPPVAPVAAQVEIAVDLARLAVVAVAAVAVRVAADRAQCPVQVDLPVAAVVVQVAAAQVAQVDAARQSEKAVVAATAKSSSQWTFRATAPRTLQCQRAPSLSNAR